jgi:hypothetical protein
MMLRGFIEPTFSGPQAFAMGRMATSVTSAFAGSMSA